MTKPISPLDGRYGDRLLQIGELFSEWALMRFRMQVEVEWLIAMSLNEQIGVRPFSLEESSLLRNLVLDYDDSSFQRIKEIEAVTDHDVKSVEYFVKENLQNTSLADVLEFVHFGCTSEDISNLAYAMILRRGMEEVWLPLAQELVAAVAAMAEETKDTPMLSHTHGQSATPTTVGKELTVFVYRWQRQLRQVRAVEYLGKFNGVVGNFNAQTAAYPDVPWEEIARGFVEHLGLAYNPVTTQIESHDYMAECFHAVIRFNNILLDFARDMWSYISMDYFGQRVVGEEVGSSTMPHKVNPIKFETCEANVGLSNAILGHLANKLAVSRLQRDLSDTSAQRNIGVGIAHSCVAMQHARLGFERLSVNHQVLEKELAGSWEVLAEAVQTVMRKCGYDKPYERLKALTRGTDISREELQQFISDLELPEEDKKRLLALTPRAYVGLAPDLVRHVRQ